MSYKEKSESAEIPSCSDVAIRVSNLSKNYQIYDRPEDRLRQSVLPRLQKLAGINPKKYHREFWALKNLSFEVNKGETIGIIGRNGAGKSTLLQMICGTLTPSSGQVSVNGRVAALLELGSGFDPEFTGRENVHLNAHLLGLKAEQIQNKYDAIIKFADIGPFIDQPVKTYSSGMMLRLAFSVIAHVDADILIIDEAMAVGDIFFAQKCTRFLSDLKSKRKTILFVSHDLPLINTMCAKTIYLQNGEIKAIGSTKEIGDLYIKDIYKQRSNESENVRQQSPIEHNPKSNVFKSRITPNETTIVKLNKSEEIFNGKARIFDTIFCNKKGEPISRIQDGEDLQLKIEVEVFADIVNPAVGFEIKNQHGLVVVAESTTLHFIEHYQEDLYFQKGNLATVIINFKHPVLHQGEYIVSIAIAEGIGHANTSIHYIFNAYKLIVMGKRLVHGVHGTQGTKMIINLKRNQTKEQ